VAKPRSLLLVHAYGHEVTGLKTYRGPKRKEQLCMCSLPGFYAPEAVVGAVTRLVLIVLGAVGHSHLPGSAD
jgi:hypothetical protein